MSAGHQVHGEEEGTRDGAAGIQGLVVSWVSNPFPPTSSNCIKPDGLLEFAKRLERWGRGAFGHLRLFQNWLDQDAVTAREAIRRLRATCHVVSDSWDSSQAFADYVSTM